MSIIVRKVLVWRRHKAMWRWCSGGLHSLWRWLYVRAMHLIRWGQSWNVLVGMIVIWTNWALVVEESRHSLWRRWRHEGRRLHYPVRRYLWQNRGHWHKVVVRIVHVIIDTSTPSCSLVLEPNLKVSKTFIRHLSKFGDLAYQYSYVPVRNSNWAKEFVTKWRCRLNQCTEILYKKYYRKTIKLITMHIASDIGKLVSTIIKKKILLLFSCINGFR